MGLDTTHDCWHGPYSMFMRWRTAIAAAAQALGQRHDDVHARCAGRDDDGAGFE